jgi:hypothetical protein
LRLKEEKEKLRNELLYTDAERKKGFINFEDEAVTQLYRGNRNFEEKSFDWSRFVVSRKYEIERIFRYPYSISRRFSCQKPETKSSFRRYYCFVEKIK